MNNFSKKNKKVGSLISFVGKVRPFNNNKKIDSMEMIVMKKWHFIKPKNYRYFNFKGYFRLSCLHRFGKLFPSDNIILILVASTHRKESFFFIEKLIEWFKSKITFWKKEFYLNSSAWLNSQK